LRGSTNYALNTIYWPSLINKVNKNIEYKETKSGICATTATKIKLKEIEGKQ
jgi:hypothetical protein